MLIRSSILVSLLILTGCSTSPDRVTYQCPQVPEYLKQYPPELESKSFTLVDDIVKDNMTLVKQYKQCKNDYTHLIDWVSFMEN